MQREQRLPNVIYILADDLGYGDLGFTGQEKFETPNIDRLARQGMFFAQHYSGATVCAPSRSALMTGQHSGHTAIRGNKEIRPEGQWPILDSVRTLAELFKERGYATGAFGKWGLGYPGSEGAPLNQGFDRFYGFNCQRLGHHYYPFHLWDNDKKVMLPGNEGKKKEQYAPQLIHEEALSFMEVHKEQPFFLYYPSIIPHAELIAPEEYMALYRGKLEPETPYEGLDNGPNYRLGGYESQEHPHAAFAAMVHLLDEQVGEIMDKVGELGLAEDTIIIFTSDNGPHMEGGADPDYFNSNGIFRGYKRDLYEGGIRVPMIAKWEGQIAPGSRTEHVSAFWDMYPTFAELLELPVPEGTNGISVLPTWRGNAQDQKKHRHLYWEFHEKGGRQALRKDDWKLVRYNIRDNGGTYELYDLSKDPSEQNDLAQERPEKLNELKDIMQNSRTTSEDFPFVGVDAE
ncbi:arylsulfatase [Maribacter sp. 2307ULW6-5]|uniref:arylsulfatase n=1 Tax=Maribacter sp. 2307ULW6-5 TaxID=3386275 RepID=UPI0039BC495A